jgi:hypothetical protein
MIIENAAKKRKNEIVVKPSSDKFVLPLLIDSDDGSITILVISASGEARYLGVVMESPDKEPSFKKGSTKNIYISEANTGWKYSEKSFILCNDKD